MARGANCWVNELRKGARGWGQEGCGKGVGKEVGEGEWNLYLNEVFYKTGIVTSD